ncbi:DUF4230 domain-containing protein [Novosphingobium sp. PASSN1]|uniref:DUF4230 domain-containing protein n=1 Tax=Novosphingobium sp. PASSN1 TaxID=2015561 RepID=UPI000BC7CF07|nr:DUF4230 domain-containing protein [Novosphingobium sp. PASSN1]OYU34217.1 MAG: hypothetical protein CFE35_16510 [Novosphingobium sp. PASSN1]
MKPGSLVAVAVAAVIGVVAAPKLPALLPDAIGGPLARWLAGQGDVDVIGSVTVSLRAMNQLTVFEARLFAIARTADTGWFTPLDTTTYVIVPGAVRFHVDLTRIERRNLNWDRDTQTLIAVLPDPVPGEINVDGAHARVIVDGLDLASGDKREAILKQSLAAAGADMRRQAGQAVFIAAAREAARNALTQNLAAPLLATGLKPRVLVRFQGEAAIKG